MAGDDTWTLAICSAGIMDKQLRVGRGKHSMQICSSLSRGEKQSHTMQAGRERGGIFQSRNKNVHTSVAVHRHNVDNRSPPKMALGEFNITVGNCMFLFVTLHAVAALVPVSYVMRR